MDCCRRQIGELEAGDEGGEFFGVSRRIASPDMHSHSLPYSTLMVACRTTSVQRLTSASSISPASLARPLAGSMS